MASVDRILVEFRKSPHYKGLSAPERSEAEAIIRERHANKLAEKIHEERQKQEKSGVHSLVGSTMAGFINFMDSATFGYLPTLGGAVGLDSQKMAEAIEVAQQTNPASSMAGRLGGLFAPLPSRVLGGAGALATRVTGTAWLADKARSAPFVARAGTQFLKQMASSGGAILAMRTAEYSEEDRTIHARLWDATKQTASDVASPTNLGMSAVAGALGAKFQRSHDKSMADLFAKYERITGKKVPASVASNSSDLHQFLDTASQTPGLANTVQKARETAVLGLRGMIREMTVKNAGRHASRESARKGAAKAVRKLAGDGEKPGILRDKKTTIEGAAFAIEQSNKLPDHTKSALRSGLKQIISTRPYTERRVGSSWGGVVNDFYTLLKKGDLTVDELEGLIKRTGEIAFSVNRANPLDPRLASRARHEARDFYSLLKIARRQSAPEYDRAVQTGRELRKMMEATKGVPISELDDAVLAGFWSSKKPLTAWRAAKGNLPPAESGALKAWLYHDLLGRVMDPNTGLVNGKRLSNLTSRNGRFNSQLLDEVLPGVRHELARHAVLSDRFKQGLLSETNARTASRGMRAAKLFGAPAMVAGGVVTFLGNPFGATGVALTAAGTAWLVKRASRSLINGALGDALSSSAQGAVPRGMTRLPATMAREGGVSGLAPQLGQVLRGIGSTAAQGARAIMEPNVQQGEQE